MLPDNQISGTGSARRESPEDRKGLPPVYACGYDHIGVILWGRDRLLKSINQALDRLERHPGFAMGFDHEAYSYDWLAENDPQLLARLRDALKRHDGRLAVGGSTYGQPLSAFVDGESNIRQIVEAVRTVKERLGYRISIYLTSEHAFHPQLPQLLAGCSFRGAVLRTHFMMYGHNREIDEPIIWWEGTDGSRIPALPTYDDQGATAPLYPDKIPGPTSTLDNRIMTDAISARSSLDLRAFRETFGERVMPLVATRADDDRSQETLIETHEDDDAIRWTTLEGAFALLGSPRVSSRFTADDSPARMPWGYCGNWIWNACRAAEKRLQTIERLGALRVAGAATAKPGALQPETDGSAELRDAWKALLLAQHHDIQICGREDEARAALDRCEERANAALEAVGFASEPTSESGRTRLLFNPLPWMQLEVVNVHGREQLVEVPGLAAVPLPADGGTASGEGPSERAPFTFDPTAEHPVVADHQFAPGEPRMKQIPVPEDVSRLETPFYDVYFGANGGIRLLLDRETGRRLMGPPFSSGSLAAVMNGTLEYSSGTVAGPATAGLGGDEATHTATVTERGTIGPIGYTSTWTFYRHRRRIDWHGEVEFDPQVLIGRVRSDTLPAVSDEIVRRNSELHAAWADHEYKLRLRFFPFVSPLAKLQRDVPFTHEQTSTRYPQGLHWTAYGDGNGGLGLLNRGLMGTILESDGALSAVLAFSLPYTWGTRLLRGRYHYELGVLPIVGPIDTQTIQREAAEYNNPPLHVSAPSGDEGTLADYTDLCTPNVVLSALYRRGGSTYVRFAEPEGSTGRARFNWNGRPARLQMVDFLENELAEVGSDYRMAPWQVQTFRIVDDA